MKATLLFVSLLSVPFALAAPTSTCASATPKPTTPPNNQCKQRGYLGFTAMNNQYVVANVNACAAKCFSDEHCYSFAYAATNKTQCETLGLPIRDQNFVSSASSGTVYYDRGCFKNLCSTCVPTASPLPNAGFESGTLAPWGVTALVNAGQSGGATVGSGFAYNSNFGCRLAGKQDYTQGEFVLIELTQDFQLCPDTDYVFSFYYYRKSSDAPTAKKSASFLQYELDSSVGHPFGEDIFFNKTAGLDSIGNKAGVWNQVNYGFTSLGVQNYTSTFYLEVYNGGQASIFLDSISYTAA